MGWIAHYKDGTIVNETEHGRPVQAGEEGQLRLIEQEDYGHKVALDLLNGVILIDYEGLDLQGGDIAFDNPKTILYVCDETSILMDLFKVRKTRPNKAGDFKHIVTPFEWRPIWFTRHVGSEDLVIKIIGLQTTLGAPYKRRNIKKLISLFPDGRIGID